MVVTLCRVDVVVVEGCAHLSHLPSLATSTMRNTAEDDATTDTRAITAATARATAYRDTILLAIFPTTDLKVVIKNAPTSPSRCCFACGFLFISFVVFPSCACFVLRVLRLSRPAQHEPTLMASRLELSVSQYVGMLTSHYHRVLVLVLVLGVVFVVVVPCPTTHRHSSPLSGVEIAPRAVFWDSFLVHSELPTQSF